MPQYILQDLNVQDKFVTTSTDFMIYDTQVVVQSVWRLLTTEEGEIPNFRAYGWSIKRFSQYPFTKETIDTVYNYVKDRITAFEERAEIIRADVDADIEREEIYYNFYLRVRATGDVVKLPTWTVTIGSAA